MWPWRLAWDSLWAIFSPDGAMWGGKPEPPAGMRAYDECRVLICRPFAFVILTDVCTRGELKDRAKYGWVPYASDPEDDIAVGYWSDVYRLK